MDEIQRLTGIYHEVQEGSLCAQHALNNLLQREIFSVVTLAEIARTIDEQERSVLGRLSGTSENMDDTGFFSIQVLQKALEAFNIELIPYASQNQLAQEARVNPQSIQAYICNLREHWFTIRRFGQQYFDLNSVSIAPKLISNTYLSLYLAQLQQSGYSIFIVYGHLPPCTADERLKTSTIDPTYYQSLTVRVSDANRQNKEYSNESTSSFDENEIQRAIKASIELDNAQDKALQQVLAQSLREVQEQDDSNEHEDDTDELNQRLLDQAIAASLKSDIPVRNEVNTTTEAVPTSTTTTEPTREEVRQRRLQYFSNQNKSTTEELSESNK